MRRFTRGVQVDFDGIKQSIFNHICMGHGAFVDCAREHTSGWKGDDGGGGGIVTNGVGAMKCL